MDIYVSKQKKFNERLEHLLGSIKFYKSDEDESLKLIENKKGNPLSCMKSLSIIYETTASKALLVDKDIESFRKNMYIYIQSYILWEMILELILPV